MVVERGTAVPIWDDGHLTTTQAAVRGAVRAVSIPGSSHIEDMAAQGSSARRRLCQRRRQPRRLSQPRAHQSTDGCSGAGTDHATADGTLTRAVGVSTC